MDIQSIPMHIFYKEYGDNISSKIFSNFMTPLDQTRGLLIAAYSILFMIGAAGNSWVACVIGCVMLRSNNADAPKNVQIFILALCCCDLLVLSFLSFLIVDLAYGQWVFGSPWLCLLYLITESLNKFCSPFLLISLSCLCYMNICQNTIVNRYATTYHGPLVVVLICAIIMFVLMTPIYIYGDVHYVVFENATEVWAVMPKCAFQPPEPVLRAFTVYSFVLGYIVPAALFTYFYSAVLLHVRRHVRLCTVNTLHVWRVAKTTMGLVCFYLICWTPYWSLNMYEYVRPLSANIDDTSVTSDTIVILGYFIHMLPYVNCCGYPILYTLLNRNITQAYDIVKNARIGRRKRRRLAANHCTPSRVVTTGTRSSGGANGDGKFSTSPSPAQSVAYLTTPSQNGEEKIRTSLITEMTNLSSFRRSTSISAISYGAIIVKL